MSCSGFCDTVLSFLRKFFSLIIAVLMALITVLYVVGAGMVITGAKSFGRSGFAHFLGIVFAVVTVIGYIILHFVPRKAYRLLYALTFILLSTMFLVAHSWGLSAPVVQDCNRLGAIHISKNWTGVGSIGTILGEDNVTTTIGTLGQPITQCNGNVLLFAAAFLNTILYIIALFDIQTVLLARVKSKTYGERFVEMGISS